MKNLVYIFLFLALAGCCSSKFCNLPTDEITNMYVEYIDEWKAQAKTAFEEAEKKVYNVSPTPTPDVVIGPNPDPAKCICKGTGIIVQGDGHKTLCEFHGKSLKIR